MKPPIHKALKEVVVPHLRSMGFQGSYPNFYRLRNEHVDLLTFQFLRYGGSFIPEISFTNSDWKNTEKNEGSALSSFTSKFLPQNKRATVREIAKEIKVSSTKMRRRLRVETEYGRSDIWHTEGFELRKEREPTDLANELKKAIEHQAETWWTEQYDDAS